MINVRKYGVYSLAGLGVVFIMLALSGKILFANKDELKIIESLQLFSKATHIPGVNGVAEQVNDLPGWYKVINTEEKSKEDAYWINLEHSAVIHGVRLNNESQREVKSVAYEQNAEVKPSVERDTSKPLVTRKQALSYAVDKLFALNNGAHVVFPAKGVEKHRLVVFTDSTCPVCRKFHHDVEKLNAQGISVAYFLFPRSGPDSRVANDIDGALCEKDKLNAVNALYQGGHFTKAANCQDLASSNYALGLSLKITGFPVKDVNGEPVKGLGGDVKREGGGTPYIIADNGNYQFGYNNLNSLVKHLQVG